MRSLHKLLAPLRQRLAFILARGVGHLTNSSTAVQTLQVELLKGEILGDIEHIEPYGFTSNPQLGYEVLAASLAGNRKHTVVLIAADRRYRKTNLAAGEVALYTDEGDYILFKRGRIVEVVAGTKVKITAPDLEVVASTKVTLTTPQVDISGALTVTGAILSNTSVADSNGTMQEMRDVFNDHKHTTGGIQSTVPTTQMT